MIVEPDRAAAIDLAIGRAGKGDVVLIAGKGHERGQYVGTTVIPFDDREVAAEALAAAAARATSACGADAPTAGGPVIPLPWARSPRSPARSAIPRPTWPRS